MRYVSCARIRTGRLLVILVSIVLYYLLLIFPKNYLASHRPLATASESISKPGLRYYYGLLLRVYIAVLILLSIITMLYSFLNDSFILQLPSWLNVLVNSYYVLALSGILATTIFSYRQPSPLRPRHHLPLFVFVITLPLPPF